MTTTNRNGYYTISNIAGGDRRWFRLVDGALSGAALAHIRAIGYGGPVFGGPAASQALLAWEEWLDEALNE